jgi:hypothetical protein
MAAKDTITAEKHEMGSVQRLLPHNLTGVTDCIQLSAFRIMKGPECVVLNARSMRICSDASSYVVF